MRISHGKWPPFFPPEVHGCWISSLSADSNAPETRNNWAPSLGPGVRLIVLSERRP